MRIAGFVLIALGILGLASGGITYTTKEKLVDVGPIHVTNDETHNVQLPPIAGAIALMGGIALVLMAQQDQ